VLRPSPLREDLAPLVRLERTTYGLEVRGTGGIKKVGCFLFIPPSV